MTHTPELWSVPEGNFAGQLVELRPAPWPDDFEWFAEGPGQRSPQFYDLALKDGTIVRSTVVFPCEPWSPYDAISDKLRAEGYERQDHPDDRHDVCEHGLSANLCSGPNHYPDEEW